MVFEYISIGLGILAGVAGVLAWVYHRGKSDGIEQSDAKKIEDKIDNMQSEGEKVHGELKDEMKEIHSKIDTLVGSFETFKQLVNPK